MKMKKWVPPRDGYAITGCDECPYHYDGSEYEECACCHPKFITKKTAGRIFDYEADVGPIPDWCPLQDVK